MTHHIEYFGGKTYGRVVLENGHRDGVWFARHIWFDRDIDGRWLVGVTRKHHTGDESTGAIVVKDATVSAFIELLGKLVFEPEHFADEDITIGPDWDGRVVGHPAVLRSTNRR